MVISLNHSQQKLLANFCVDISKSLIIAQLLGTAILEKPIILASITTINILLTSGLLLYVSVILLSGEN